MDSETATLRQLMEVGRRLLSALEPEVVFETLLEEARRMTGARYAALGVVNEDRSELARLLTAGIDPGAHRATGELPRGPGVLGIPIIIAGQTWGNLYLTEKDDGQPFTQGDEDAAGILAQFAATAIDNARRFQRAERGRLELTQALRGLEAARTISNAIGTEADLNTILELIVKRGRALVSARSVLIMLAAGDQLELVAGTGTTGDRRGTLHDIAGSVSGRVMTTGIPLRVDKVAEDLQGARELLGVADVRTALVVPMIHRGHGVGVLIAVDRGSEQEPFSPADEELLLTFSSAAANAVAISRSVASDRLRATIDAAEEERRRWARELHDQTLQSLGGLRVLLSGARRKDELEIFQASVNQAVSDLEFEIQNLRGIIADLRPPLLDDLGLRDALSALISRHRDRGLFVMLALDLTDANGEPVTLAPELETTIYRLIQEALSNVVKHAQAHAVAVDTEITPRDMLVIEIRDDGLGFDTARPSSGFGMAGMRERAYLAGGSLRVQSGPTGTSVRIELPTGVHASRARTC